MTSSSNEDGIPGNIEEWTTGTAYRRVVKREFDESEIVVTGRSALRRDWNGWIRELRGQELKRLRTAIFENDAIVLGPPALAVGAAASMSDDGRAYLLRITPPGGVPMTWYVNAKTWLPIKSVRPGEDSEITTAYDNWRTVDGILTPDQAEVSETDKPPYRWKRTRVQYTHTGAPSFSFAPPKAAPTDAHLDRHAPPIPFSFETSHILLKVSINGREPIWFILDTGADQNVIDETRLADFGLKTYARTTTTGGGGTAEYSYASDASFTLPGAELRRQHVAVLDQTGLERAIGLPIGGILGYDFISRFVVEIDYENKLIRLHDPATWTYTGAGAVVPITFDTGIPFADGVLSVAGRQMPAYFVLDFGAAETMTLTSPFVKANDLLALAQTNASVNRPAGLENQFFAQNNVRGRIDQLSLGKLVVRSIPVNMSVNVKGAYASANFSGTVGESIYRRYHVFLDYARNRVIFEPTPEADKPFPERQTYGLSLLASGPDLHTYTVAAVRPGSPAEADGFQKGDVIAAVDAKPAAQFTLGELRDWLTHAGEHHQLQIARGGRTVSIPIEVRLVSIDKK